jgi:hypothetical protein
MVTKKNDRLPAFTQSGTGMNQTYDARTGRYRYKAMEQSGILTFFAPALD